VKAFQGKFLSQNVLLIPLGYNELNVVRLEPIN